MEFTHSSSLLYVLSLQTTEPDGKKIVRVMYKHAGNDVSGVLSRSEKIVNTCEKVNTEQTI